ncbi:alpha/beta fold hydrolase [Aestuariicoccus sp. MJ-SS9]|uniref:alpha/beta fold hydrolase n=1 Tax=Aestuariicoccus sp. MJ-SS9 TaxID=3079855 RepID=UPI00290922F9|nr:alpha/beta fold hydrolase [Aestuariicoccus sp. MJ-SS9]MDU8910007.1 alpha/beta fold hydrolase [Aestuariicoccus sp. MJ-SS9]
MRFDIEIRGSGPPVLFLPGSYSTPRAWAPMFDLIEGWQMLSVSLPGYGTTPERRRPGACHMADMTGFVTEVAERIGAPFHLVGHSFGGQIALAAALEGTLPILSLITFEANPIYARHADADFAWRSDTDAMVRRFEEAVAAQDRQAAGIIIDYWSSPGTFAAMPEPIRAFCADTAGTNLLDWKTAQTFTPELEAFAALNMPCTLCRGGLANAAIRDVTDLLTGIIPDSRQEVVDGADHFLISTHPGDCARIVTDHLRRTSA